MGRKIYTTPRTELFRVELEGTFASSVNVQNPNDEANGRIDQQMINSGFGDFNDTSFGSSTVWTSSN